MKNILSIVGARPNFIKLSPIHDQLKKLDNANFKHYILHTGQHYDFQLSQIFFEDFNLPEPDYFLDVGSMTSSLQIAEMIKRLEKVFLAKHFDLVLVYGDTNSTFAGAFSAKQNNLKIGHIEAGLRSYDKNMPEEINRVLTDHISEFLYVPTQNAIHNLKHENLKNIIYTGDISVEIIERAIKLTTNSKILQKYKLKPKKYYLCTLHRAENTNFNNLQILIDTFREINEKILFPIHPRTLKVLNTTNLFKELNNCKNVIITEPLRYIDIINVIKNASKVITDSGGIQKESYILKIPCITVRNVTEWIETLFGGWNIITGIHKNNIIEALNKKAPTNTLQKNEFGNGNTSQIICNHIKSILN